MDKFSYYMNLAVSLYGYDLTQPTNKHWSQTNNNTKYNLLKIRLLFNVKTGIVIHVPMFLSVPTLTSSY